MMGVEGLCFFMVGYVLVRKALEGSLGLATITGYRSVSRVPL